MSEDEIIKHLQDLRRWALFVDFYCYFLLIKCENPLHCILTFYQQKINFNFLLIKCENPLHPNNSHILSTKNNNVFVIFIFEILKNC